MMGETPTEHAPVLGSTPHGGLRDAKHAKPRLDTTGEAAEDTPPVPTALETTGTLLGRGRNCRLHHY